jgi:hypothetical protein
MNHIGCATERNRNIADSRGAASVNTPDRIRQAAYVQAGHKGLRNAFKKERPPARPLASVALRLTVGNRANACRLLSSDVETRKCGVFEREHTK